MARKIFINLPVRDVSASKAFFAKLGFEFNPKFTDENAACMVLSSEGYVMLAADPFFKTFTDREMPAVPSLKAIVRKPFKWTVLAAELVKYWPDANPPKVIRSGAPFPAA